MRLQLARRSRHAGAAAFIDKAQKASRFSPTPWKAMKNIEQHYEQIELSEMAIERERERLWTNWGFQSGVWTKSCIWQLFWSLLVCVERFILALGHVGSWQEAWKLFKRYDLNNDGVLSPPLPQDLSIGSFISMAHDLNSFGFHMFRPVLPRARLE